MKIKIKNKKNTFGELLIGTPFTVPYRGGVYIKTHVIISHHGEHFNAVNLEYGTFHYVDSNEEVIFYDEVELG